MNIHDAVAYLNESIEDQLDRRTLFYRAVRALLEDYQNKADQADEMISNLMDTEPLEIMSGREQVLRTAREAVLGDRNNSYGEPSQDFACTSALWNIVLLAKIQQQLEFSGAPKEIIEPVSAQLSSVLSPDDVALFQILLKCSRQTHMNKFDNWVDMAGYAACGWDATP